ncbi:hypothetical protein AB0I30_22660 [Nocardia tengchongensis]|uniref:hypothetical protein n=1 Tax=Nocardia tengchongensis TaxID=2055889 RepID=UPI0033CF8494
MAQLCLESDGCRGELLVVLPDPHETEINAVESGRAQFAWVDGEHVALLAFRFDDGFDWSDAPYTPDPDATVDGAGGCVADARLTLCVTLVDGNRATADMVRRRADTACIGLPAVE